MSFGLVLEVLVRFQRFWNRFWNQTEILKKFRAALIISETFIRSKQGPASSHIFTNIYLAKPRITNKKRPFN